MKRTETTTRYTYDDQRVAVQTLVSGGVESDVRYYVFGNTIDEVLVMGYRFSTSWINFYYAHDHLYSPVALLAANGTVAERYEYDVYGKVHILAPNYELRTASLYGNPYTFTGRELDTLDAGSRTLMYYRARTYDPDTGRFLQRDPIGTAPRVVHTVQGPKIVGTQGPAAPNPNSTESQTSIIAVNGEMPEVQQLNQSQYVDGMNLYQYCQSDPVNYVDPWGLECGVVVKRFVSKGTGASSWIDMGHEWLSTGNGSIGFWPNGAGISGREWSVFSPDPGESYPKAPDIIWDTKRNKGWFNEKKLKWGSGRGEKCCQATCSDITSCVLSSPDPGWRDMPIFNNCRKYVDVTLNGCCLSKGKRR